MLLYEVLVGTTVNINNIKLMQTLFTFFNIVGFRVFHLGFRVKGFMV